jgi:hypothetical protein
LPPEYSLTKIQIKEKLKDMCVSIRGLSNKKDFAEALIAANAAKRAQTSLSKTLEDDSSSADHSDDEDEDPIPIENGEHIAEGEQSRTVRDENDTITKELMKSWFMAPFRNSATKIGTENENNVIRYLAYFIAKHSSSNARIFNIKEYGLLARRENLHQVFSPDGIVGLKKWSSSSGGYWYVLALLEIKTHISETELQKEHELRRKYGEYVCVSMVDPMICSLIWYKKYRAQLLHGMATGLLGDALYVVASSTSIIRIVHIIARATSLDMYNDGLELLYNEAGLDWTKTGVGIPQFLDEEFKGTKLKYAVDNSTILHNWKLCKAMEDLVTAKMMPLPKGKFILPMAIALWNRCKGPIDVYSRYLHNLSPRHACLSITGSIWLRLIMTAVYNAYMCFAMCKAVHFLLSDDCISYRHYQNYKKREAESFAKFITKLCKQIRLRIAESNVVCLRAN